MRSLYAIFTDCFIIEYITSRYTVIVATICAIKVAQNSSCMASCKV